MTRSCVWWCVVLRGRLKRGLDNDWSRLSWWWMHFDGRQVFQTWLFLAFLPYIFVLNLMVFFGKTTSFLLVGIVVMKKSIFQNWQKVNASMREVKTTISPVSDAFRSCSEKNELGMGRPSICLSFSGAMIDCFRGYDHYKSKKRSRLFRTFEIWITSFSVRHSLYWYFHFEKLDSVYGSQNMKAYEAKGWKHSRTHITLPSMKINLVGVF